jgi:DNA-binding Lrp family transcriptional regulator
MPSAFVLIGVEAGTQREVASELKSIGDVKDVYLVFGVYDIVVKVEANTERQLKETITYAIRRLEKVRSTQTLLTMD